MSLSTVSASGSQASTQNPQTSAQSNLGDSGQTSNLQPDVSGAALTSYGGITLPTNSALPSIDLNSQTLASQSTSNSTTPTHHALNGGLLAIALLLFLVAAFLFGSTMRGAKKTTDY